MKKRAEQSEVHLYLDSENKATLQKVAKNNGSNSLNFTINLNNSYL